MSRAETTFKLTAEDYQALVALLRWEAGIITIEEFNAIMTSQGRPCGMPSEQFKAGLAHYLVGRIG